MQRAEAEKPVKHVVEGFNIDNFEHEANGYPIEADNDVIDDDVNRQVSPHREDDLEPEEMQVDLNLTHQVGRRNFRIRRWSCSAESIVRQTNACSCSMWFSSTFVTSSNH